MISLVLIGRHNVGVHVRYILVDMKESIQPLDADMYNDGG